MEQDELSDTAVSPVVAVILMVAITVILSAVIGTFALDLGQQATSGSQSTLGVQTSTSNGTYTATIVTGEADEVELLVNGTEITNKTNVSPGDRLTANVSPSATVTLVKVSESKRTVILSETVDNPTSTVSAVAPTDGLLAHWTMDSSDVTSTTVVDVSSGYNASINGNPSSSSGKQGEALSFDGTDDNATYEGQISFSGPFTFSFWMKADTLTSQMTPMFKDDGGPPTKFYIHLNRSGNDKISADMNDGSNWKTVTSSTTIKPGTYYHVTISWNGSYLNLYVNGGSLEDSVAMSSQKTSGVGDAAIGSSGNGNHYFDGRLDDIRLYNQSLNQSEVNDLYDATK